MQVSPPLEKSYGEEIAFPDGGLTLGFFVPFDTFVSLSPKMLRSHLDFATRLDGSDFAVLWARDRLMCETGGRERAEMMDPWVYLGALAASTRQIAIGSASIIVSLRHPIAVAKAAASVDRMSGGRFLLGIASGVRQEEYPAFGIDPSSKAERFRDAVELIRRLWGASYPTIESRFGAISGLDLQPKPLGIRIPVITTGWSGGQSLEWIATNSDGWFQYLMDREKLDQLVIDWRGTCIRLAGRDKPLLQGAFLDLRAQPGESATDCEQGFRGGRHALTDWLSQAQQAGVNHVAFNLKRSTRPYSEVVDELTEHVAPLFKRGNALSL